MKKKIDFKKGNAEFVGLAISSILIISVFLGVLTFLQLTYSLNELTKASLVSSRAAATASTYEEAMEKATKVAEVSLEDKKNIKFQKVKFEKIGTSSDTWRSGQYLRVTVFADIKNNKKVQKQQHSNIVIIEGKLDPTAGDVNGNQRLIYDYLTESMGFSKAGAIGLMANIYRESNFIPTSTNPSSGAYGICQWLYGRKTMLKMLHASDYMTLTAQLDYLNFELKSYYFPVRSRLINSGESKENAKQCAEYVLNHFEKPEKKIRPKCNEIHNKWIEDNWDRF